jgi:hypothetical protein
MACPDLRATEGPEEKVGSLARVCARFAPNFGPGAGHQGWGSCLKRQHRSARRGETQGLHWGAVRRLVRRKSRVDAGKAPHLPGVGQRATRSPARIACILTRRIRRTSRPPRAGTQRLPSWLVLLPIKLPNAAGAWSASGSTCNRGETRPLPPRLGDAQGWLEMEQFGLKTGPVQPRGPSASNFATP